MKNSPLANALMVAVAACVLQGLGGWSAHAAAPFEGVTKAVRSNSMQFFVHPIPPNERPVSNPSSLTDSRKEKLPDGFIRVNAESLGVSAERVKGRLLRLLDAPDQWRGKIHLLLQPQDTTFGHSRLTSARFADGWRYRLAVPEVVRSSELIRDLVDVLLLEIANRTPSENGAEIPLWLAEALTRHIALEGDNSLLLQPETSVIESRQHILPERFSREQLQHRAGLSFTQISMPTADLLAGERHELYKASAHVLFVELSRLDQGPAKLRSMLASLASYWNWQTAFMKAFESDFKRPLDVEKWWAVTLAQPALLGTGRDRAFETGRRRLDEVLKVDSEVRFDPSQVPNNTQVGLMEVIRDWDYPRQKAVIQHKANQLAVLQWTIASEWVPLVDAYKRTLLEYIERRDSLGQDAQQKGAQIPRARYVVADAIKELERLERERIARQPEITPPPASNVVTVASPPKRKRLERAGK